MIGGNGVKVVRSPEPNDIICENLGYSEFYKMKKRIFTHSMTGLVLIICFAIILMISSLQVIFGFLLNMKILYKKKRLN